MANLVANPRSGHKTVRVDPTTGTPVMVTPNLLEASIGEKVTWHIAPPGHMVCIDFSKDLKGDPMQWVATNCGDKKIEGIVKEGVEFDDYQYSAVDQNGNGVDPIIRVR